MQMSNDKSSSSKGNRCAIALGSNLGDSLNILRNAVKMLAEIDNIELISRSNWYKTKAIGPPQPDYCNGCLTLKVNLTPEELLKILFNIEQRFGRIRKEKWGPRTLDLDLILYEDLILNTPFLQLPHPRMREREFVLIPLAEIAPDWLDPVTNLTILDLKNKLIAIRN
jgi:2-amino-4-hydroxy-6-hydroxymethyldihydropteridine diphosphokinase